MRTDAELEREILNVLQRMRGDFPELLKYIDEMPYAWQGGASRGVETAELAEYFNSLVTLFVDYTNAHIRTTEFWRKT